MTQMKIKEFVNELIQQHQSIMVYRDGKKLYWLKNHHRYLSKIEMLQSKVLICNLCTLNLKQGFNYLHQPL